MKKTYLGIILIIVSLVGILGWEFYGRDMLMYTEVLTVNQDIESGTVITQDMLAKKKLTTASTRSYRPEDVSAVIGMEATSFIPYGSELYEAYFENPDLIAHSAEGEYILPVPSTWIAAFPQSLRRGDTVTFLLDGQEITSATVKYVKDSQNTEVTSDSDRLEGSSTVAVIEIIVTKNKAQKLQTLANEGAQFVVMYQQGF